MNAELTRLVGSTAQEITLEASRAILERGDRLTTRALGNEMGVSTDVARARVDYLRRFGRWPHQLLREIPKGGERRKDDDLDERLFRIAAELADPEGTVNLGEVARAMGLQYNAVGDRVRRLRENGRWPYHVRNREYVEAVTIDKNALAEIQELKLEGIRDGRGEVDLGIEPCWSGRGHWYRRRPDPSPAQACKAYLQEWREVTSGRAQ